MPSLPAAANGLTTVEALEAAALPAVARPPCVVTFSGGRDSSLVLAIATRVARRNGLPDPIPATIRFVDNERAEESAWQELVIRHLGLENWVTRDIGTDLDFVGPLASRVLRRHGVLWPLNVYLHESLIAHAAGGSLMTGVNGDSVFGGGRYLATNELLARRRRPRRRDGLRLGLAFAPPWVKRGVMRRRVKPPRWLQPAARKAFVEAKSRADAAQPLRADRWLDALARRRSLRLATESMDLLAADVDALVVQPLTSRLVMATVAHRGGSRGIGDRTAVMRSLFADLLPDEVLARPDKAMFAAAFVGQWTDEFARGWNGEGVDTDVVDPEVLKAAWCHERFDLRAALLLQSAWLHQQR
jgi:asparagine synthase (glutamine-hydrolysing)